MPQVILEPRRPAGHVVDDHVGHHLGPPREGRDVVPPAQAVIDLGVIDRVEAGVGAIDRMEERQHVHASERTLQRPVVEQLLQVAKRAARKAIDVGDQLCLALHRQAREGSRGLMIQWAARPPSSRGPPDAT